MNNSSNLTLTRASSSTTTTTTKNITSGTTTKNIITTASSPLTTTNTANNDNSSNNSNNNNSGTTTLDGTFFYPTNARFSQLLFYSFERIDLSESQTLDPSKIVSKLYCDYAINTVTLNLPDGQDDGQLKIISLNSFVPSSSSTLVIIKGRFTIVNRVISELIMKKIGSSMTLVWDTVLKSWYLTSSGALLDRDCC